MCILGYDRCCFDIKEEEKKMKIKFHAKMKRINLTFFNVDGISKKL